MEHTDFDDHIPWVTEMFLVYVLYDNDYRDGPFLLQVPMVGIKIKTKMGCWYRSVSQFFLRQDKQFFDFNLSRIVDDFVVRDFDFSWSQIFHPVSLIGRFLTKAFLRRAPRTKKKSASLMANTILRRMPWRKGRRGKEECRRISVLLRLCIAYCIELLYRIWCLYTRDVNA